MLDVLPPIDVIDVLAVLIVAFVASVGWHLGARLVGWLVRKRS